MRSSAPKFDRRNISRPNTTEFLAHPRGDAGDEYQRRHHNTNHGRPAAFPSPVPRPQSRRRKERQQGSVRQRCDSPKQPESQPGNQSFSVLPDRGSTKRSIASRSAARLVSQTHRVHQYITGGMTAQSQPLQIASLSLKHLFAIRKIGMQVSAEKRLLRPRGLALRRGCRLRIV